MRDPILVTGASGYLGRFVTQALREAGPLRLFDLAPPDEPADGDAFVRGDVTDLEALERAMAGCRTVVHLVALVRGRRERRLDDFIDIMVGGTWRVFEAAVRAGVTRVVNCSSIVAGHFGPGGPHPVDARPAYSSGDLRYALSKVLGEEVGLAYHQAHDLAVVHIRPGIIAGDGANPGPKRPEGEPGAWFLYVDPRDVAGAIARAVRDEAPAYGTYPVVADRSDTAVDLTGTIDELGYRPRHNWPEIAQAEGLT